MEKIKNFIFSIIKNSIKISKNKNSIKFLGTYSFLESIIIPIPTDIFLIPIVLAKKNTWFYIGILCTLLSVLGGITGYFIGYFFWDTLGNYIITFYNAENEINIIKEQFSKYGLFIIILAGFSPLPYKIFTIGSGLLSFNFLIFVLCSLFSRGLRFISLSFLVHKYGEKSISFVEKYFFKLTIVFIVALVLAFLIYSYA